MEATVSFLNVLSGRFEINILLTFLGNAAAGKVDSNNGA